MTQEVFKTQPVKVLRDVWTFHESELVPSADSSVGFVIPENVEDAFYENGYKIRVNRVASKIEVYAYRYSLGRDDGIIYLSDGESVELRGYADIRKITV